MASDSFVGEGLTPSPYKEVLAEYEAALDELRDLEFELLETRKERDHAFETWRGAIDMTQILPDCMMPDGADPCAGYQQLAARVRELEAERDDYKAQAKEYWDIGLKRERERDALRALLREAQACLGDNDHEDSIVRRIDATLAGVRP